MLHKLRDRAASEKGFTLIELLVVILIIGILAAIALPAFLNQRSKAQDTEAESAARTAQTAMETYYTDEQTYVGATVGAALIEPAARLRRRRRPEAHGHRRGCRLVHHRGDAAEDHRRVPRHQGGRWQRDRANAPPGRRRRAARPTASGRTDLARILTRRTRLDAPGLGLRSCEQCSERARHGRAALHLSGSLGCRPCSGRCCSQDADRG